VPVHRIEARCVPAFGPDKDDSKEFRVCRLPENDY